VIIVKLQGGLGNQLFQYAAARALSWKRRAPLKLDLSVYGIDRLRSFSLDAFQLVAQIASHSEINEMIHPDRQPRSRLYRAAVRLGLLKRASLLRESQWRFYPEILTAPGSCYLDGYWQSHRYFADCPGLIHKEFTLRQPLSTRARELTEQMQDGNSVSLHIRRGDYANNPVTEAYHGLCSPEYYAAALARVEQQFGDFQVFVFSDEPAWARENLSCRHPTVFIDRAIGSDAEELIVMSHCRHHVLANSSFSWWGAWLPNAAEGIVIAPKKWFNDPEPDTSELLPPHWLQV